MPYTRLVELSPDAMFVNCDGKFVFANQATANVLGFSTPAELIGLPVLRFVHPAFHDAVKERIFTTMATGEPVPYMEQVYVRRDGSEVTVSVAAVAFTWQGQPAIEVCARDITDRKCLENEAIAEREAANQANLGKSRLVTAVSHDLRQPLQSLALFTSVVEADPNLSPQSRMALNHLIGSISRMGELLDAVLKLARIDAQLVSGQKQPVEVDSLLIDVGAEMALQAQAKGLELRRVKTTAVIETDPVLMLTILRNLIANAIRYTEQGKVLIGVHRHGDHVMIGVHDTGIGIDADKLKLVFEEFYQVGNPSRDSKLGLGLGLSIVERLTRILGHRVFIRSKMGKGSSFCIEAQMAR